MKKAFITVGLGFGDEGKGATVDYLVRKLQAGLVVRYSGGAQAGHNVQLPDGRRHTFAQFGAGTLAGAKTFLGPRMIACPATLRLEADHLVSLGIERPRRLLTLHPDCLLSTTYHMSMNRLKETDRGANRHGSCGLGIGESRSYWLRHGLDAIVAADLQDPSRLTSKLALVRDRMLLELQELNRIDPIFADAIYDTDPGYETDKLLESTAGIAIEDQMPDSEVVIFEGAQGVLLDEYFGFHPHTTWSTVTARHAIEMTAGIQDVTTLGLTRAYSTRHGAGPFPTYCPTMSARLLDTGNPENDWQGEIQFGPLDLVLLKYALRACPVDGLVVNHVDELDSRPLICHEYEGLAELSQPKTLREQEQLTAQLNISRPIISSTTTEELLGTIGDIAPIALTAHGPTWQDRQLADGPLFEIQNEFHAVSASDR